MDSTRVLHRILMRLQGAVIGRPWRVLAATGVLVAAAAALGAGVQFRTSRSDLAPKNDPDEMRLARVSREFRGASDAVVCVEAAPGAEKRLEDLGSFADELAERLRSDPEVAQVYYKVDADWLSEHALYLVPPATLEDAVEAYRSDGSGLASVHGLASLNEALAARIEAGLGATPAGPAEDDPEGAAHLADLLRWEKRFVENPEPFLTWLESGPPLLRLAGDRPELAHGGYLATRDGATLFLLVSPRSESDDLATLRRFIGSLRRIAAGAVADRPGFRVALTGEPAMTVEEMGIVRSDTWFTAAVAAAGVVFLTLLVFRWRAHALLVLAALAVGVVWALGAVRLELGYLNLITSSFISTLVGVGVAYAIHPVSEYELQGAHTSDPDDAVRSAYHATGAAVTTGGVTTAAAFFSILLMHFRGFAELGLVAGVGILLCLVAALVTLPALLVIHGRWRHARDRSPRNSAAAVDRLWVDHGAGWVCAFPKTTTAAAVILTALLGWAATKVTFDTSILDLLPRNAESVRYLQRMIEDSDLSPNFAIAVADDLPALEAMSARAGAEETIGSFDSALMFLPEDPAASRKAVAKVSALLDGIALPAAAGPATRDRLAASLARLEEALGSAADTAFGAGLGATAGALEDARSQASALRKAVTDAPAGMESRWASAQERMLAWAHGALADLRRAARADPPVPGTLPTGIRERFVARSGHFVALMHASESVFQPDFLDRFVAACRRVSPDATGFPIVFRSMSMRITAGFHTAAVAAAAVVFLILLADFRSFRRAGLALLPLGMGVVWMMGGMRLFGLSWNFANLVAVPLIIGVGIDNGVHVIHRIHLEHGLGMAAALRHTGRAIIISSLTTMIGFGSLALASHRGLSSLGTILLMGVGACLVTSTLVLPNILVASGAIRR